MSNYEEVKYKLRDFIIENTSIEKEKIFFATERFSMPEKPYIMITELSSLEDLESGYENKGLVKEITNYKNSIFTVAIYNLSENDMDLILQIDVNKNSSNYLKFFGKKEDK